MPKSFGEVLQTSRKSRGLSLDCLADFLIGDDLQGYSRSTLSRIECGRLPPPPKYIVDRIAFHIRANPRQKEQLHEAARYTHLRNAGYAA